MTLSQNKVDNLDSYSTAVWQLFPEINYHSNLPFRWMSFLKVENISPIFGFGNAQFFYKSCLAC